MANTNQWGLTERGFRRPTYVELLDAIELQARAQFGPGANLTVRSPLGMFLRIYAWALNLLFSAVEEVYNSRFIDTAVGTSLYNLGRAIGLRLLPAQKASGYLQVTGRPGVTVPAGWMAQNIAGVQFVVMTPGEIAESGEVLLAAQAVKAGPSGNVGEHTVKIITFPGMPSGITAVTNPRAFDGGRERETDEQYRDRYYKSVDFAGGVNADAIRAEILQNVEGVHSAIVYENDTDFEDANGLPPHSFEVVVYGGLDVEIAGHIFRRKAAGIQTHGTTMVPVLSASDIAYEIRFSRPNLIPIYIRVDDLRVDVAKFPHDGRAQMRQALIDYIGSDENGGLTVGEDVFYNRLPCRLYSVSGVLDFTLTLCTDGVSYGTANIPIGTRDKAVTAEGLVIIP